MRKDDGSKMQKWTLKLRETHPAAAQCRLRRAKGHYELVGTLSDGRRIAKRLSGAEDEHEALEKAKVQVIPGSLMKGGEGLIRVSYATSLENIHEGVRRLQTWLESRS